MHKTGTLVRFALECSDRLYFTKIYTNLFVFTEIITVSGRKKTDASSVSNVQRCFLSIFNTPTWLGFVLQLFPVV